MSDNHQTPQQVSVQIQNLAELMRTQFAAIQTQFTERDAQVIAAKEAADKAIEVALTAQKEVERVQNESIRVAMLGSEKSTLQQLSAFKDVQPKHGALMEADLVAVREKVDGMNGQDRKLIVAALVMSAMALAAVVVGYVL